MSTADAKRLLDLAILITMLPVDDWLLLFELAETFGNIKHRKAHNAFKAVVTAAYELKRATEGFREMAAGEERTQ